jgi:hypothetical protein
MSAQFRLELWKVNLLYFIALTQFFDSVNEAFMEINGFSLVKNFNTHFIEFVAEMCIMSYASISG